jgi:hypothetical protein
MSDFDDKLAEAMGGGAPKIGQPRGETRFVIDLSYPLPEYDTPGAKAYSASDPVEPGGRYYALVSGLDSPRREGVIDALLERPSTRCICPLYDGVIEIDRNTYRPVTVQRQPGPRIWSGPESEKVPDLTIRRIILPQLAEALNELKFRNITHRNIRPESLFWRDENRQQIILGECYSFAPGLAHAPEAEQQARCMVAPTARGDGAMPSDLSAAGYLVLTLLEGRPPSFKQKPDAMALERAIKGSGLILTSGLNVSASMMNMLRGLMNDEPASQWGPDQIKTWAGGGEPSVRPSAQLDQFIRPCKFNDGQYMGRRALSRAFGLEPKAAAKFVASEAFTTFVETCTSDQTLIAHLKTLVSSEAGKTSEELQLAKVRLALDPAASVVLDGHELMVDGLGPFMAHAFVVQDHKIQNTIRHGFELGLFTSALDFEHPNSLGIKDRRTKFGQIANYCKGERAQNGVERILYDLNPGLPCQSPLVKEMCVRTIRDLLIALNLKLGDGSITGHIIDRHIEGFIAARAENRQSKIDLLARAKDDRFEESIALIKIFGALQDNFLKSPLIHITSWLAEGVRQPVEKFKNRARRESTLSKLDVMGSKGSCIEMAHGLDIAALRERDKAEYRNTLLFFLQNVARSELLQMAISPSDKEANKVGRRAAAAIGITLLIITTFFSFLRGFA